MTLKTQINRSLLPFGAICKKISKGEHFSFARYGDGEFNAILGKQGTNCDGHKYYSTMGTQLGNILRGNPSYYIGIHQDKKIYEDTEIWLNRNQISRVFAENAVFHCATRDKVFQPFWDALTGKKVTIIAPAYVKDQTVAPGAQFIEIPGERTYEYLNPILKKLKAVDLSGNVVLICASMTAPILVHELHKQYSNTATFIDFGSSFDPVVGVRSRSFHK